jgi:peptide chain release factor 1
MQYLQRLDGIETRFEDLTRQMTDPDVINDNATYRKVSKQQSELGEIVAKYRDWKKAHADADGARQMLQENDPELQEMAREDIARLEP